jgi:hypothetical protein
MCLDETFSKVHIGKHSCNTFPILNGLKQGDALLPLLFNFALEYAITKVEEKQVGMKLNGTHQILVCAVYINLLTHNINTTQKNTETLIGTYKKVGLKVNSDRTKYMLTTGHQNEGKDHNTKLADRSFKIKI